MTKNEAQHFSNRIIGRLLVVVAVVAALFVAMQLFSAESATALGFDEAPAPGDSLLKDYFGVNLALREPHSGGNYHSFDLSSFEPTNHTETASYEVIDWYGNWNFNTWDTTTIWGLEPTGGEWYDVEAMYVDNDEDNIYVAIVTSCPHYYEWSQEPPYAPVDGVGIYEFRYEDYDINPFIVPGDLCINLSMEPRTEKGGVSNYYDFGIDIVHEQRNPKYGTGPSLSGDSTQHTIREMHDAPWGNTVGSTLYNTTADPGGADIGDPYLDRPGDPNKYDWYTANLHEVSEWQHTNFDPNSTWSTTPSPLGDCTVYYYEYEFPGGLRENNAGTFVIEAAIPRSLLGEANPEAGDSLGIQWVTGCRNEGIKTASTSHKIRGTIGDYVWNDADEDGCQDPGEAGIEGVTVELYSAATSTLVQTTSTNSDGYYSFTADPADYYIRFEQPTGWMFTSQDACADATDSDAASDGETEVFTLPSGTDLETIDAGLYGERAEIGDYVWEDEDGDGLQESGENGIGDVTVRLYESGTPTPVATTTTAGNGEYLFTDVSPGDYYLTFEPPTGWVFTQRNVGSDDTIDSDADAAGMTAMTTLDAGEQDLDWDCGLYQKATIGDYVWEDLDGDGVQASGEPGIEDAVVKLYKDGVYQRDTTTDADGLYSFKVAPGTYRVKFLLGTYDAFSPRNEGGDDDKDSDPNTAGDTVQFTVRSGETQLKWDAGLIEYASIGDYVWEDLDGDGVQESGETGLPNLQVELHDSSGLVDTDTTDSNGNYLFDDLLPGDYHVVVPLPADYFYSPRYADGPDLDSNVNETGHSETISLVSGEDNLTIDAGVMPQPETRKEFYGTIYYDGLLVHHLSAADNEYEEYITPDTIIYLNYTNPAVLNQTMYRIWRMDTSIDEWVLLFDWMNTTEGAGLGRYPINLSAIGADYGYPCSGLYQIEFYSIDIYGNVEPLKWNTVYVDCTPPTSHKTYGDPSVTAWDRQEWMHWIGPTTPITITGDDGPGSGTREIWYQIYYPNGTLYNQPDQPGDFTTYTGPIQVSGPDGIYHIYYKAVDQLGNVEQLRKQRFILDNEFPLGNQSQMWFTPSPTEVAAGTSGTIQLSINATTPLTGVQCSLSFNPSMIHIDAVDVVLPVNSSGTIDNAAGTVTGIFGTYPSGTDNITTTQLFATIEFTAGNYTGETTLTLTDVVAVDEHDSPVTVLAWPGTVTVTGAPPTCPYDLNDDGWVNDTDAGLVSDAFGLTGPAGWIPEGWTKSPDVSGPQGLPDGEVNIFDIVALARHWGACP